MKENEKMLAFMMLGASLLALVAVVLIWPPDKDSVVRIVDAVSGGFLLALGGASNALFRSNTPSPSVELPLPPQGTAPPTDDNEAIVQRLRDSALAFGHPMSEQTLQHIRTLLDNA